MSTEAYTTEPRPSHVPALAEDLHVKLDLNVAEGEKKFDLDGLAAFQKAANYLAVAQIFLQDNALLKRPLKKTDIKPRLLGHWGTCPGIIFLYAHLTALIQRHETHLSAAVGAQVSGDSNSIDGEARRMLFVTGPGHGAPALLSTLFLEGSISHFYSQFSVSHAGIERFVKAFSWPGSPFPSHVNSATPGSIHEGGELGYALAVAYGSVMDKPDLITTVIVGDGEAETGPTATAWHAHKFIDPKESGAVLPVLHCNKFKISEKTISGTMDDRELLTLFTGYGYQVRIVKYANHLQKHTQPGDAEARPFDVDLATSLEWAYEEIKKIQRAARSGKPVEKPRWPMIILVTPKGWGTLPKLHGLPLEDSFRSHQVPLPKTSTDDEEFHDLEEWLGSYEPAKWFRPESQSPDEFVNPLVRRILPEHEPHRMGMIRETYDATHELKMMDWKMVAVDQGSEASAMDTCGKLLEGIVRDNPHDFRIFSPDELESNHLSQVFKAPNGHRNFQWDPNTANKGGRVIEMLSEHTLQGFSQGYSLTGRTALFPSYESFLGIVSTMIVQYAKFIKTGKETTYRRPVPSITYIQTSTLWRQEHNGFSHQNPGLINTLLNLPHDVARIYLPPDANCAISTLAHCLRSRNYVNLLVGSKNPTPAWLSPEEADKHCIAGGTIWEKYSTDSGVDPDVVLVGIGVEVTAEIIAASAMLRKDLPGLRVRVVNITDLMILAEPGQHPHALTEVALHSLFTEDKPVVVSFHGYPSAVEGLLHGRLQDAKRNRIKYLGYREEGTTTTPWSMLRLNGVDRYSVGEEALSMMSANKTVAPRIHQLSTEYQHKKRFHEKYVEEHGSDPAEFIALPDAK